MASDLAAANWKSEGAVPIRQEANSGRTDGEGTMPKGSMADDFASGIEGELKGMDRAGIGLDMHIRNIKAHIQNALYHAKTTPDLDRSANNLAKAADIYGRQFNVMRMHTSETEKKANSDRLEAVRSAYLDFRRLIQAAEPSAVSQALGG